MDPRKLIRRRADPAFVDWKFNATTLARVLPEAKARINTLSDLVDLAGHFVAGMPEYDRFIDCWCWWRSGASSATVLYLGARQAAQLE